MGVLFLLPGVAAAMPRLELDLRLDPVARRLEAAAVLGDTRGLAAVTLSREAEIIALAADGKPQAIPVDRSTDVLRLPRGTRELRVRYRLVLAATGNPDHRQVLAVRRPAASAEGSFLPAGSGWYPDPGVLFSYRAAVRLPAGQKGLVPGRLLAEQDEAEGYRAEFEFPHPAEGVDLMAGPLVVKERSLPLGARQIRLRTWFHPELAALADGYLEDSARYLQRYSRLIGDYPYDIFSVVSSPTPTGYGMPTLTYLGRDVLRLPFIRTTSLGHEVLHNWWGNGVYPDWPRGNWSEGLTTFLADYAYKEDEGVAAAREMRIGWLRDYAAVPPGEEFALSEFRSRHHGIASIIGYNKSAMVFLMLRDRIGREAFERGLRLLWERHRFRTASWGDLERAFSEAAGRSQAAFFRQWVLQAEPPPLTPAQVAADTDYRLWRRIDPSLLPPILREVFVAPRAAYLIADPSLAEAVPPLLARLLDDKSPRRLERPGGELPLLVFASEAGADAWLAAHSLPPRPPALRGQGTAQVWAMRPPGGRVQVLVVARDAAALRALERGLPHYGRQGWIVFDGARATARGVEPPAR